MTEPLSTEQSAALVAALEGKWADYFHDSSNPPSQWWYHLVTPGGGGGLWGHAPTFTEAGRIVAQLCKRLVELPAKVRGETLEEVADNLTIPRLGKDAWIAREVVYGLRDRK